MNALRLLRSWPGLALAVICDLVLPSAMGLPQLSGPGLSAAFGVQALVTEDWLDIEGVVGTAVGMNGHGQPVVKVYLTAVGVAAFPASVAGVAIQPEVTGPFVALGAALEEEIDPKQGFPRPVPIGVSAGHPGVTAGTIGARVTDGLRLFGLSNNHVFANNNQARPGDNLLQPGVADGGSDPDDLLGTLHDFEPIEFCNVICPLNHIDAAVALTTSDDLGRETPENGYGAPRSSPVAGKLNQAVQKYGRTTGHTRGTISGINATIDVNYRTGTARFVDQIVITGDGFSAGGDSGSLIVTDGSFLGDRRPVGLLFAGSPSSTIANPIGLVLDRFGVSIDGG